MDIASGLLSPGSILLLEENDARSVDVCLRASSSVKAMVDVKELFPWIWLCLFFLKSTSVLAQ